MSSTQEAGVVPGSLWITARRATIGTVDYERLAPVLVAVAGSRDVHGRTWCRVIPFAIDEPDPLTDEIAFDATASSLGMPLWFAINNRLCLHPAQLDRAVGQLGADAREALRAALAGARASRCRGAARAGVHPSGREDGRPDLAVLMVLQRAWLKAGDVSLR
jgi:hypothetical protein